MARARLRVCSPGTAHLECLDRQPQRSYVDVEDLTDAHIRAAEALEPEPHVATYNAGRGEGSRVP